MKKFKLHPYTILSETIKNGIFESLVESLIEEVENFENEHTSLQLGDIIEIGEGENAYFDSEFDYSHLTKEFFYEDPWRYLEDQLEDDTQTLINGYFERAEKIIYTNVDLDEAGWYDKSYSYDVLHDLLYHFITEDLNPNFIDITKLKDHFILNDLRGRDFIEAMVFYMSAPFVHFLWKPIEDLNLYKRIKTDSIIALTGDDPILLGDLKRQLSNVGIRCKRSYLYSVLVNDENFLTLVEDEEIKVDRSDEIIKDFEVLASSTSPNEYFSKEGGGNVLSFGNLGKKAELDEGSINRLVRFNSIGGFAEKVDKEELAFKLLSAHDGTSPIKQKDLDQIYDKIVNVLITKKKLTSWREICTALKMRDIPLDPYTLGPGRIMAYAPGKRFLAKKDSAYVLREWVENDQAASGKILKERIVTPFETKEYTFTKDKLYDQLSEDSFHLDYSILDLDAVAMKLALGMPDSPIEIFYQTKIKELIEDFLGTNFVSLRKGSPYLIQVEDHEKHDSDNEVFSDWRVKIISKRLGTERSYLSSHLETLEQSERTLFYKILGRS